jgi:hypothetical protein
LKKKKGRKREPLLPEFDFERRGDANAGVEPNRTIAAAAAGGAVYFRASA